MRKVSYPEKQHQAFTIIEVLVSVVLISIVALGAVKLQQESRDMALYLSNRGKNELSNTLFLGKEALRYHKEKKDAYSLISNRFKISDTVSRDILKKSTRSIFISDPVKLSDDTLPIKVNEILLKGHYSSRFFHFDMQ
ncbi:MAG TPA: prepilin-type N-terminal cleavage/methylation domain-containing protein [Epsilonproteobacteria bacterium]|nr:prepilin-type N-terminal cleavage/methylation domain-containing protein [Campylobacterota bacterium]